MKNCVDKEYFFSLSTEALKGISENEFFSLDLISEDSTFLRFNSGKVRQAGEVNDSLIRIRYSVFPDGGKSGKSAQTGFTLSTIFQNDLEEIRRAFKWLRTESLSLPIDPYAERLTAPKESLVEVNPSLPSAPEAVEKIFRSSDGLEFTGIYSSGQIRRALVNSVGARHWYSKNNFLLDYSLHGEGEKALKGYLSRTQWDDEALRLEFQSAREKFTLMNATPLTIARGAYRTFLAPAAVAGLIDKISSCSSEMGIRQGDSPFRLLRSNEATLSDKFSLTEDFSFGDAPRFDSMGGLSPEKIHLIQKGKIKDTLISPRTALEFGLSSNGASADESAVCASLGAGSLLQKEAVEKLGEGLYLSDLHYLNWSDQPQGRITGMTRFACFWVENGGLKAPIQNLRWDDSLFSLFGSKLEEFTSHTEDFPNTSSYEFRGVGSVRCPGALVQSMQFTL
jgi:predicted Zn-dependent protease